MTAFFDSTAQPNEAGKWLLAGSTPCKKDPQLHSSIRALQYDCENDVADA